MMNVLSLLSSMSPYFEPVLSTFSGDWFFVACSASGGDISFGSFWLFLLVFSPKLNTSDAICLCFSGSWALVLGGVTLMFGSTWTPSSFFYTIFSPTFSFLAISRFHFLTMSFSSNRQTRSLGLYCFSRTSVTNLRDFYLTLSIFRALFSASNCSTCLFRYLF